MDTKQRLVLAAVQLTMTVGGWESFVARLLAVASRAAADGAELCVVPRLDPAFDGSPEQAAAAVAAAISSAAARARLWVMAATARGAVMADARGELRPVLPGVQPLSAAGVVLGPLPGRGAWSPELARILSLRGAEVLVAPVAVKAPYGEWEQVAGPWQVAQQNQAFLAEAGLAGRAPGGEVYVARTAIFGPCEITPGDTGVLARVDGHGDEVALATLDLEALAGIWRRYPIFREFNWGLYERQLGAYYGASPAGEGGSR